MEENKCNKQHYRKNGDKPLVQIPCYYNAGVCVVDQIHEGGLSTFLRATYPYHHSSDYEKSKLPHSTIIPSNILVANVSFP